MSSSEGFTPQNKPRRANCPYFTDEQTETQRTMTCPGSRSWEGGCAIRTQARVPSPLGSLEAGSLLPRGGTSSKKKSTLGVPLRRPVWPQALLPRPRAVGPDGSPSSTVLDPSAGKGLPAWSDGYIVTCGTEFSRSSCLLYVLNFKEV